MLVGIWTGSEIKTLKGHTRTVNHICSVEGPNGECWLASGSFDKTIRIWDIATGSEIKILNGHTDSVTSVCCVNGSNGECWLASGSWDKTVRTWDIATESEIHLLGGEGIVKNDTQLDAIPSKFDIAGLTRQVADIKNIVNVKTKYVIGPRRLEGGDMQLQNVVGLSNINKTILLNEGGASFDQDFVEHCESSKFTKFQAQMMAKCYVKSDQRMHLMFLSSLLKKMMKQKKLCIIRPPKFLLSVMLKGGLFEKICANQPSGLEKLLILNLSGKLPKTDPKRHSKFYSTLRGRKNSMKIHTPKL
eukprot:TRINITY_DN1535_c0_g1_i5.p1 TRINITY_DN1535_c0_g1~~TRINITY_DN1535_c0_g1_i5.p1  ORF type:complete len:303 (+),score=46.07 TRINITY_DN1535_c0_g1_i5:706-1614(+)